MNAPFSEDDLRAMLAGKADEAPDGGGAAERFFATTRTGQRPRRRWLYPVAAAAVFIVAVGVAIGVLSKNGGQHDEGAGQHSATFRSLSGHAKAPPGSQSGAAPGFRATDVSFDSADHGWVLGTTSCSAGSCGSLMSFSEGAPSGLVTLPMPVASGLRAECTNRDCVNRVHAVSGSVAYVYGPNAVWTSTDSGRTWHRQGTTGAVEIASMGQRQVLVRRDGEHLRLATAARPGGEWAQSATTVPAAATVNLVAGTARAYLGVGAQLYTSTDPSAAWAKSESSGCATGTLAGLATDPTGAALLVACRTEGTGVDVGLVSSIGRPAARHTSVTVAAGPVSLALPDPSHAAVVTANGVQIAVGAGLPSWQAAPGVPASGGGLVSAGGETLRYLTADGRQLWRSQRPTMPWAATRLG